MASCAVKLGLARVVGSGGPDGTHPRCQVRKEEPWSPLDACAVKLGLARDLWFGGGVLLRAPLLPGPQGLNTSLMSLFKYNRVESCLLLSFSYIIPYTD